MNKYSTVAIADITKPCKYQGVTCYGRPKHMERTEEMIAEDSYPNGYTSYGWRMKEGVREEIKNPDFIVRNVSEMNAYGN